MKNNKGIGLLELILAFTIIAVMLSIVVRYYTTVNSYGRVNTAVEILQSVIDGVEEWKAAKDNYSGITAISDLVERNLVPSNFSNSNINPWGGSIAVVTKDAAHVTFALTNIPKNDFKMLDSLMQKKNVCPATACSTAICVYTADYPC